jgi:hypothetical protein
VRQSLDSVGAPGLEPGNPMIKLLSLFLLRDFTNQTRLTEIQSMGCGQCANRKRLKSQKPKRPRSSLEWPIRARSSPLHKRLHLWQCRASRRHRASHVANDRPFVASCACRRNNPVLVEQFHQDRKKANQTPAESIRQGITLDRQAIFLLRRGFDFETINRRRGLIENPTPK